MLKKQIELKSIYSLCMIVFLVFLLVPMGILLVQSLSQGHGIALDHYVNLLSSEKFTTAFFNSFKICSLSALTTTTLAFILAYTYHYTNCSIRFKKIIETFSSLPMYLPTITYGFAILYTFGKQGVLTKLFHGQLFELYGFWGLLIGYVIYTLPIAFLLMHNAMKFIDKKFILVSKIMQDKPIRQLWMTVLAPLVPTLAAAFIQAFFLSFTDFGIPAALGGEFSVVATTLYNEMLGAVPNFQNGAVIAMFMLIPSILSVLLLNYLDRYQIRYVKVSEMQLPKNKTRDRVCWILSSCIGLSILTVFAVIFLLPFISSWPYNLSFTFQHIQSTLTSANLLQVYRNSLFLAIFTAILGCLVAYGAALVSVRSQLPSWCRKMIDSLSSISNTIPGMVLGIAFLFTFSGTSLQNTFLILILCNLIHFFSAPYIMAKNALGKMNASYETTAMLMGDSWFKTIRRVVLPNSRSTLLEMFSYYFINSMVTISALIFLVGAKTAVLTTKIKELQHFAKFDEIFVLSLLILITNLGFKKLVQWLSENPSAYSVTHRNNAKALLSLSLVACFVILSFVGGQSTKQVIIYSNADEEALIAIRSALDNHGYADQYLLQSFGTSELGGKLLAEGLNIEADLVTMSSYYIESAQTQSSMFLPYDFTPKPLSLPSPISAPITALEGALIINTTVLQESKLPVPTSLLDLTNPIYQGQISIPDIHASSTGWLLVLALIDTYGLTQGQEILQKILTYVGPHLESSGSGPIKKVRSGEVAIAFGLRHQALADQQEGLPIQVVDPIEGNFQLTESLAIINKEKLNPLTLEIVECILSQARKQLLLTYPTPLYPQETIDATQRSLYPKIYSQPLNVQLLQQHQEFFASCQK